MDNQEAQKKVLWLFITAGLLLTFPYIVVYRYLGAHVASFAILGAIPFLLLTGFVWRVTRSASAAGNWVVAAGFSLFFISAYFTGGIEAPALSWSLAIPIVATLLCGWRSGVFWLILVLFKISFFYWTDHAGHSFVQEYPSRANLKAASYVTMMGITCFAFFLALVTEYFKKQYLRRIEESNLLLKEALDNIKTLKGMLPMCAWCKKIRNDQGYWDKLENYLTRHSEAKFSHGMCPDCQVREMGKVGRNPDGKGDSPPGE